MDIKNLTKKQIIEGLKNNKISFMDLSEDLKNNKKIMLEVVKENGRMLLYVSDRLKDNKEIVWEAVKSDGFSLIYVSDRLKDDKNILLEAIKSYDYALLEASDRLQNDVDLLEVLEKVDISHWQDTDIKWYQRRMEVLNNIKEKQLMKDSITLSDIKPKKIKF